MKGSLSLIAVATFSLASAHAQLPPIKVSFEPSDLVRISIFDLVQMLRSKGVKVSFVDLNPPLEEHETVGVRLRELQALPYEDLTPRESAVLKVLKRSVTGSPEQDAKYIIGPKYHRSTLNVHDFILPDGTLSPRWVEVIEKAFPQFTTWHSNTSFIIEPRKYKENLPRVTYKSRDLSIDDAMKRLQDEILSPSGLSMVEFSMGMNAQSFRKTFGDTPPLITLDIENEPLTVFLTRFAEAISPDVYWTLLGGRVLSFSRLPEQE